MEPVTAYQEFMRSNSDKLMNHVGTQHDQKTIDFIAMVPEGKNFRALLPLTIQCLSTMKR